ncbi:MAG: OmpA family protein [Chitinophagaceae bacterium]|nr:MAG: OmpA family protein [Chitinophagaceae bacterium]
MCFFDCKKIYFGVFLFFFVLQHIVHADEKPEESIYGIENLGQNINSQYDELAPVISPDGRTLYFVRSNHPDSKFSPDGSPDPEQWSQDIWVSRMDENGEWSKAERKDAPFNKARYNSVISVTPDGNTLLINGAYERGNYTGRGFSFVRKTSSGWSEPKQVFIRNFQRMNRGIFQGAFLSNDNRVLLIDFSERRNGVKNNLYVSFLESEEGIWSEPIALGGKVNTNYNETAPFLASDGVTLYFASDRPEGLGSSDIYRTRRLDDTWQKWSEPVNLGPPINTPEWDGYYSIDAKGEYAYMVSYQDSYGGGDIVRVKLTKEHQPDPVVVFSGRVINAKTGEPLEARISYETLPEGTESGIASSSPGSGRFQIVLPYGKNYGILAEVPGFLSVSDNLDLTEVDSYRELERDLMMVPIEVGQIVRLNNIFFDFAKASLRSESFPELNRIIRFLSENPKVIIKISGHTDNVGSDSFNLKLSEDRAAAVKNYLRENGIPLGRIESKGYGKNKPVATNDTEEGRQMNRRVEFTILNK